MLTTLLRFVVPAFAVLALLASEARAHPHVWVTVRSEIVYAPDGSATAVRHRWTFDEMFSTFATLAAHALVVYSLIRLIEYVLVSYCYSIPTFLP